MSKRPSIDLMALTSEQAAPMPEGLQRTTTPAPASRVATPVPPKTDTAKTATANLQALAFKVPPEFRKRFRQRAANADLKLNELLFAALDAWENQQGLIGKNS